MADEKKPEGHQHLRPQWSGRDILDKDHAGDLDRESALHEFDGKLPRHEAEDKAYSSYTKTQHAKAAAHHLTGIKLAEASGDSREAGKHGLMYQLHLQALGHETVGPVPDEVQQHLKGGSADDGKSIYKFKVHPGDIYVLPGNLGKQETHTMATQETPAAPKTLTWTEHDDNSGGFLEAVDTDARLSYRTWAVPQGAKPVQHVLVKTDEYRRQTTCGYFAKAELAQEAAEGQTALAKAERDAGAAGAQLSKAEALAKGASSGLAALKAAQAAKKELSAGGSGGEIREGSSSPGKGPHEESSTAGGEGSSAGGGKPPWLKSEGSAGGSAEAKCGKCGAGKSMCKCGNFGKSELCKRCGKSEPVCKAGGKCKPMTKGEAAVVLADGEAEAHKARLAEGTQLLAKVATESFAPMTGFGTDAKGQTTGTSPAALAANLRNVYVVAKAILDGKSGAPAAK
jgi:hypothetical protein